MKTVRITGSNGASVNVVMDYVDGDDAAAIAVAQECIDANTYKFDEPGDVYQPIKLTRLVREHYEGHQRQGVTDEADDGAHSAHSVDVGGYTALWTRGIHKDSDLCICAEGTSIEDWVRSWDNDAREWCEAFGFGWGDEYDVVGASHWKEVVIQVIPHFYAGTLGRKTNPHLLTNDVGNVIIFDDFQAAKAWIDEQDESVYVLAHGEYARPDYQIMDAGII